MSDNRGISVLQRQIMLTNLMRTLLQVSEITLTSLILCYNMQEIPSLTWLAKCEQKYLCQQKILPDA